MSSDSRGEETADLSLKGVRKVFNGSVVAVDELDLEVGRGELVSLLGPSGCGKTTTLRMIAGFIDPDAGRISIKGRSMAGIPAHKRDIGLVFQNYSLFPHMTVAENIAYGLRMRGINKEERLRRVVDALALVDLRGVSERRPAELSGGQQQRVALARAVVIRPSVLLLDEPLSNLDANLRHQTRWEIRRLQKRLGITTVLVTHDQDEALTICDRVAVMNEGRIEQIGPPREIYGQPATRFVASFVGDSNLIAGRATSKEGRSVLETTDGIEIPIGSAAHFPDVGPMYLSIRPEAIRVYRDEPGAQNAGASSLLGIVESVDYLGHSSSIRVRLGTTLIRAIEPGDGIGSTKWVGTEGRRVWLEWSPDAARLIAAES